MSTLVAADAIAGMLWCSAYQILRNPSSSASRASTTVASKPSRTVRPSSTIARSRMERGGLNSGVRRGSDLGVGDESEMVRDVGAEDAPAKVVVEMAERVLQVLLRCRVRADRMREVVAPHQVLVGEQAFHPPDDGVTDHAEQHVLEHVLRRFLRQRQLQPPVELVVVAVEVEQHGRDVRRAQLAEVEA